MALGKRWTVPFESLHGVACRVDIYDEGWTGSVTTLLGADNPFYYQEDDDNDMLLTIRYRTGYLRLVCRETDDFSALYPIQNTDRYIEFYYGNTLDFNGFIQAQDFGTDYAAPPYVVELPVISPLGMAAGTYFDANFFNVPRWMLLRDVIAAVLNKLDANYDGFIFPKYIPTDSPAKIMGLYMNSLAFCPFGTDFDKSTSQTIADVYDPKTIADALDIICTGFGVILHDAPGHPVFQRIDYTGDYVSFSLTSLGYESVITPQVIALPDCSTVSDNDGETTTVMPLTDIKVDYDGDEMGETKNFDRCRAHDRGNQYMKLVTNDPFAGLDEFIFPTISGVSRPSIYISVDSSGKIPEDTVALAAYGKDSLSEAVLFRPADASGSSAWGNDYLLFKCTFYGWNGRSSRIKFTRKYGESLENMNNPTPPLGSKPTIKAVVSYGSSQITSKTWSNGEDECEIGIGEVTATVPYPLVVAFYAGVNSNIYVHALSGIRLEAFESVTQEYIFKNNSVYKHEYKITGGSGYEHGEVTRGTGLLCPTINRLRYGSTISGTDWGNMVDMDPDYPYMLVPQKLLTIPLTLNSHISPANIYCDKYTDWNDDTPQRRIIARSFEPWNDKTTLMLHSY